MKKQIFLVFALIVIVFISMFYRNSEALESNLENEIIKILNHENSVDYFTEKERTKIRVLADQTKVLGYSDLEVSVFQNPEENKVYALLEAKNPKDTKIKGVSYITMYLGDNAKIESIIVSEWVNIKPDKANF